MAHGEREGWKPRGPGSTPGTSRALASVLAVALALGLAVPARGGEPATAPPNDAPRQVELVEGQPAPFAGSLCDKACAEAIFARKRALELERDALAAQLKAQPAVTTGSSWTVPLVAVLVVGAFAAGIYVGARATR